MTAADHTPSAASIDYTCAACSKPVTVPHAAAWPSRCSHCGTTPPTLLVRVGGATVGCWKDGAMSIAGSDPRPADNAACEYHQGCSEPVVAKIGLPSSQAIWTCERGFNEWKSESSGVRGPVGEPPRPSSNRAPDTSAATPSR